MTTIAKIQSSELSSQKKICDLSAKLLHITLRLRLPVYQDFEGQGCQDLRDAKKKSLSKRGAGRTQTTCATFVSQTNAQKER